MALQRKCEVFLLRYVPDALRDEYVNIGVIALEEDGGFAGVRFTRDWRRVRCLDPDVDLEYLALMEADLRVRLADVTDRVTLMRKIQESFSGALHISSAKATDGFDAEAELANSMELYVDARQQQRGRRVQTHRERLLASMQSAFTEAGVWDAMAKQIAVARYTRAGDPLKLDCGYRAGGEMKLFHALALTTSLDSAHVLALSYPKIRDGMYRELNVQTVMTAIVDDALPREQDNIAFALALMQENDIQLRSVAELPQLALQARRDMNL